MKGIESIAHHEGLVQGKGSVVPIRAKRWGASRKGSAPPLSGLVSEVLDRRGMRASPSVRLARINWDGLNEAPQPGNQQRTRKAA